MVEFFLKKYISCQYDWKKVLQSAPCHKDYIYILTLNIGTWETGQRIEQTDRQTDKPNYNIDIDIDFRLDRSYIEYVYDWLTVNSFKSITFIDWALAGKGVKKEEVIQI